MENSIKIYIAFLLGILITNFVYFFYVFGFINPLDTIRNCGNNNITPGDFIREDQIKVYEDFILINISNASIGRYKPTGSMRPILDKGSNGIRVMPESSDEINVGDIITFEKGEDYIIHRVMIKGFDEEGYYFITKGDNNGYYDKKIRFEQIKYKTIAIIY